MKKLTKLEQEAKAYQELQKKTSSQKAAVTLNARRYFAGQAMVVLMGNVGMSMSEIRKEAYKWADYMLENN
jgi:hypothetical protein|tara:strand:+ start:11259 stop:11471 length:213 start_codon:yes stop_codon:yes gene_type:complete